MALIQSGVTSNPNEIEKSNYVHCNQPTKRFCKRCVLYFCALSDSDSESIVTHWHGFAPLWIHIDLFMLWPRTMKDLTETFHWSNCRLFLPTLFPFFFFTLSCWLEFRSFSIYSIHVFCFRFFCSLQKFQLFFSTHIKMGPVSIKYALVWVQFEVSNIKIFLIDW